MTTQRVEVNSEASVPAGLLREHARWLLLAADLADTGLGPDEIKDWVQELADRQRYVTAALDAAGDDPFA